MGQFVSPRLGCPSCGGGNEFVHKAKIAWRKSYSLAAAGSVFGALLAAGEQLLESLHGVETIGWSVNRRFAGYLRRSNSAFETPATEGDTLKKSELGKWNDPATRLLGNFSHFVRYWRTWPL